MHRIEVYLKPNFRDVAGEKLARQILDELKYTVKKVSALDVYTLDFDLPQADLKFLGENLFSNPLVQEFSIDKPLSDDSYTYLEVGFKPGVTDNVGQRAKEAIEDILKIKLSEDKSVYTSKKYLIVGEGLNEKNLETITKKLLANELIQRWSVGSVLPVPRVKIHHEPRVETINLNVTDDQLLKISSDRKLALNLQEIQKIKEYFGSRKATDAELEALAQTWSEHCKHKIFNAKIKYNDGEKIQEIDGLFDTFIKSSTKQLAKQLSWVVSVLWDNAGLVRFNKDLLLAVKCETHNSPSAEEPFGGAETGIVGVYRDIMGAGLGCNLIFGTYGFCTGNPFYSGELKPKIHPKRLLEGVRKGVESGGNKSGVPTVYGITFFDEGYMAKPAIFVSAGGLIPLKIKGKPSHQKRADPGDLILMAGGRVGIDGIHGATESSMESGEQISSSHVQIGDPFTQKKLYDFLMEARDFGLLKCITDNGAGGLSSSVGEMAKFSGGFELWLDKVSLKYSGLDPWQILVSESQERMTSAVEPSKIEELLKLAKKHDVEATVVGKFTDSRKFHCVYKDKTVTDLDMDFLHNGVPQMELEAEWLSPEQRGLSEPNLQEPSDYGKALVEVLGRINIASKEFIVRQFDHEVQGKSVVKHLVGKDSDVFSDAAVLRPSFESKEGIAVSVGINPIYGKIDTYWMAALALDEAIRRIIAVGGSLKQIALNDNFCWPSPLPSHQNQNAKYKLAQLVRANQALYDFTLTFKTPCVSGKDSMSMDGTLKDAQGTEQRLSALPTLQFTAVGKIDNVEKCVTMDVKTPGDFLYVLGETRDELGGSEYYEMRGELGLNVPKVDAGNFIKLYNGLSQAIEKGYVKSAHGLYKGGLAVGLAQIAFAGGYGLEVDLDKVPNDNLERTDKILYSESAGRFLLTVSPENVKKFEASLKGSVFQKIGEVKENETLKITYKGKVIIQEILHNLKETWQKTFKQGCAKPGLA
ncbi:MAG: phosphoribosylformylglycinamidine synthase [Parcubacteria group bacterium Gr01-1014_30]|nr:MAG: phosphoribosylformylglycinamidine synthase [Parcubacteria group bacterium Gr01-1014_30]